MIPNTKGWVIIFYTTIGEETTTDLGERKIGPSGGCSSRCLPDLAFEVMPAAYTAQKDWIIEEIGEFRLIFVFAADH